MWNDDILTPVCVFVGRPRLSGSDRAVKLREIADQITARKAKLAELEVCTLNLPA
jgi:hypothetical protein